MIDHYQPSIIPFFGSKSSTPNPLVKRYFYWSWEDGLWDLLRGKQIKKGSTILVPDFYCSDVIDNMRLHGYTVVLYKLNQYFQVKKQTLLNSIRRNHPSVVIIFHACGIKSTIMTKPTWMKKLGKNILVIEDCVQQLLSPPLVKPTQDNHFFMDSLRKVSPFYGSFLYGTKKGLHFQQTKRMWSLYSALALLLYSIFRFCLVVAHLTNQPKIAAFSHKYILKTHDNLIGNSMASHRGLSLIAWLTQWMNIEKLERVKREQVKLYEKMLASVWGRALFYRVKMKRSDYKHLHVYPVGLRQKAGTELLAYLWSKNIVVWPKFTDSAWAKKRDVLFFPLGFHINKKNIKLIAKTLLKWKTGAWKLEKPMVKNMSPHLLVRAAQAILSF